MVKKNIKIKKGDKICALSPVEEVLEVKGPLVWTRNGRVYHITKVVRA